MIAALYILATILDHIGINTTLLNYVVYLMFFIFLIVQAELLNVVKGKIENSERGKNLLSKQLEVVKRLKTKIVNDTNREIELFNKFKEYSKTHPEATYEKFLKDNI